MAYHRPLNDEDILNGFASLHQAMATGFDRVNAEFNTVRAEIRDVRAEIQGVRSELSNQIGRLEQRVLQKFDETDARIATIESRQDSGDNRPD